MPVDLHWLRPGWLWLLLPLGLVLVWLALRARQARRWEALVDAPLRPFVLTATGGARPGRLLTALGAGWLLLVLALAGPAWRLAERPVFRIEQPRVLLLDLSESMLRTDVAPSRLARARFEAMDLLGGAAEGQFALIGFGAEPFLIAPLTTDAGTIVEQVPLLTPAVLPLTGERRTDLALNLAGRILRRSAAAAADVILVTDAVAPPDQAQAAAAALAAAGHRVSVLALAPVADAQALARAGRGVVVASRADDLDTARLLALQGRPSARAADEPSSLDRQWRDDGPWLLLLALPLAAIAFRRGWLAVVPVVLLVLPPAPVQAGVWDDLWLRPEQQALRDADAGRLRAALARVDDPRWRAALHYRAGDYAGALAALAGQSGAEAHYNRGNVLARLGRFEAAVAEYDAALALAPEHADARANRRLLLGLMKQPTRTRAISGGEDAAPDPDAGGDATAGDGGTGSGPVGTDGTDDPVSDRTAKAVASGSATAGGDASGVGEQQAPAAAAKAGEESATAAAGGGARGAGMPAHADPTTAPQPDATAGAETATAHDAGQGETDAARAQAWSGGEGTAADAQADASADAYLLRQVPNDPGRLLRERLMLQYLRRHGELH